MATTTHIVFSELAVGALFVTGPGNHIQIKLDNKEGLPNIPGGNARFLYDGSAVWIPSNRIVAYPTKRDFRKLADDYNWEQIAVAAASAKE